MWEMFAIIAGMSLAFGTYGLALEICADVMSGWESKFDDKLLPMKRAYKAHIQQHKDNPTRNEGDHV